MSDYPAGLKVVPLTTWPGVPSKSRVQSQFSAPMRSTLEVLERELFQLQARTPLLEVAIPAGQFRLDGRPRAGAKAEHPGVVLSLPHSNRGPLRYPADRFTTWQDNLRAIALGLEALRKVDRYGITPRGEQYAGFRQIESGSAPMDRPAAMAFLAKVAQWPVVPNGADDLDLAYRQAAKLAHPDTGGTVELFQELQRAMSVIRGDRNG